MAREFQQVGVVGLGTMGAGIVEVFARSGLSVVAVEKDDAALERGRGHVEGSTGRAVARGKLTEADQQTLLGRVEFTTDLAALAEADLVVEAVPEQLELKRQIFSTLDGICKPETILASNTSSLSITEIAVATGRPGKVVGMHFFNPAPVMKLVEIITTPDTAADVDETVRALTANVGKVGVSAGDRSGFIVNLLLFPYLNDAIKLAEGGEELATIDAAIKETASFPMGPFELLDVVGNDVSLAIQKELYGEFGEPGFAPAKTLEEKVAAGELGRKTGKGFHTY